MPATATNTLITPSIITKTAMAEFMNQMVLIAGVDRQMDLDGRPKKIGDSILLRRNVRYLSGTGMDITSTINDTVEGNLTMTLDQWKHVPFEFERDDLTLTIEDFSKRYIKPAVTELVQQVELSIANLYTEFYWFLGTPGSGPATYLDLGECEATLDEAGVPFDDRAFYATPRDMVNLADGLKGIFDKKAVTAVERSSIGEYANFDTIKCQSLATHTVGAHGGTPLVNGASQNVTYTSVRNTLTQSLITDGWTNSITDVLLAGDVITIAGVNAVNRRTRQSTGQLQTFTVTEDATSGASTGPATLTISPPIITSGAYQTVDAAPADDAVITVKTGTAGAQYPQNLFWQGDAITMGVAIIEKAASGTGVASERVTEENLSILYSEGTAIDDLSTIYRFDILYGLKVQNPGFGGRRTS